MSDTDTYGITVGAGIELAVGNITAELKSLRRAVGRTDPLDLTMRAAVLSAGETVAVDFGGGPSSGRRWHVRRLTVTGGVLPFTASGAMYAFVTGTNPLTQTSTPTDVGLVDYTTTIPNTAFYSSRQIVVRSTERLWCVFTGTTSGTTYTLSCHVEDWPDQPRQTVNVD